MEFLHPPNTNYLLFWPHTYKEQSCFSFSAPQVAFIIILWTKISDSSMRASDLPRSHLCWLYFPKPGVCSPSHVPLPCNPVMGSCCAHQKVGPFSPLLNLVRLCEHFVKQNMMQVHAPATPVKFMWFREKPSSLVPPNSLGLLYRWLVKGPFWLEAWPSQSCSLGQRFWECFIAPDLSREIGQAGIPATAPTYKLRAVEMRDIPRKASQPQSAGV